MSKKRRENQEKRKPMELTRLHVLIGIAVVVLSAGIAIAVFTLFGGDSLSGETTKVELPALGAPVPAERSTAADLLNDKTWDDMTLEEQELVKSEFLRAFENVSFRAFNTTVIGIDIFRRNGNTRVSRQYTQLKEGIAAYGDVNVAESLIFYCPAANDQIHAVRYVKLPLSTNIEDATQEKRAQPWDIIISGINWEQGVTDLGWRDFEGMRLHGLRLVYNSNQPEVPGNRKEVDYWFDVETARLIQRQAIIPDKNTDNTRYTLIWREVPPVVIPEDQDRLDCVDDVMAMVAP